MVGEIAERHDAAVVLDCLHDALRWSCLVEGVWSALRDLSHYAGDVMVGPDLASARRGAVEQQILSGRTCFGQQFGLEIPASGDGRGHGEALLGVLDGGLEDVGEGHPAEARDGVVPAHDRSRHRPGVRTLPFPAAAARDDIEVQGRRRAAAAVERRHRLILGPIEQSETVAADAR